MRRNFAPFLLATAVASGCSREAPQPVVEAPSGDRPAEFAADRATPAVGAANGDGKSVDAVVASLAGAAPQERYDAALLDALNFLADKKYADALGALKAAREVQDTEQVRGEIDKVQALLDQQAAAVRTARDITTVLNDGKADEAARLGTVALKQFGGTDVADDLERLKRQADAVAAAPLDDAAARRARFRQEADAALRDQNLRTAAIALEQLTQSGEDADARRQLDDVRGSLSRYDECRQRAARLRRDPAALEDALAALQDAQKAWDTPQVRLEIDEYTLALQKRRDRISVADFEVRGDVGVPLAGRTVAEELLPGFRSRFDLVERGQLGRVLDELRLEATTLADNPEGRQAVAGLAKVRYLVVGSLSPLNGVTAQARLVDVRSGLIVQTARLSAPTVDALVPRLPTLAQILMMTDDQKMAFELAQARQVVTAVKPIDYGTLPPPPPPYVADAPAPPPIVTYTPAPLAFGGLGIADFRALPPVGVVPAAAPVVVYEEPRRQRLLALSLELGDNLFRRGRHREAHRHFELALSLTSDRAAIDLRIDRCRPFLPPPPPPPVVVAAPPPPPAVVIVPQPVVVVAPPPLVVVAAPPPVRPRMVVFNFFVNADPGLVPPACGDWAADLFASHWTSGYDVVERGEVCWYMGRLGITMRDVLADPGARRCLAQALNVRFMFYGTIEQTASFNVSTHMIDAETGARTGTGMIHVQDHNELKLRMHELARQTGAPAAEQAKLAQAGKDGEKAVDQARKLQQAGNYSEAAAVSRAALKEHPGSVALQALAADNESKARQAELEAARRRDAARQQAEATAARERAAELTRETEAARARAEQAARARSDAERRAQEEQKQRAYQQLWASGDRAAKEGRFAEAAQALQSAVALKPSDDGFRTLAAVRTKAEETARARAADEQRLRDAEAKRRQDEARAKVAAEQRRRGEEEAARRKVQDDRDRAEAARFAEQSRQALAKGNYDAAQSAAQSAARLHKSSEVNALLAKVRQEQSLAEARKKGEQARAEAERKLAEEKTRREKADAEARRTQDAYAAALRKAQQAVADRHYEQAAAAYREAAGLYKTDAALTGLKQTEELRDREKAQADAALRQRAAEAQRVARVRELTDAGRRALDGKQYDRAVEAYREASRLAPGDVETRAALARAEHARDAARVAAAPQPASPPPARTDPRAEQVRQLVADARRAGGRKDFAGAARALTEANRFAPNDPSVAAAARELAEAKKAADTGAASTKQRQADYELAMGAGRNALRAKNYVGAANAFKEALRLAPDDRDAAGLLRESERLRTEAATAADAEAKRMHAEGRRRDEYNRLFAAGRAATAARRPADAVQAYEGALRQVPGDPEAARALREANAALEASRRPAPNPPAPKPPPAGTPAPTPMPAVPPAPVKASAPPPAPPAVNPREEYSRQMQSGAVFEKQRKLPEAAQAYRAALKQMPADPRAAAALRGVEFAQHMAEGQRQAAARHFPEAAREYEEALKLVPDNAEAKAALRRAKEGKR